jgi:hypothetical protein
MRPSGSGPAGAAGAAAGGATGAAAGDTAGDAAGGALGSSRGWRLDTPSADVLVRLASSVGAAKPGILFRSSLPRLIDISYIFHQSH